MTDKRLGRISSTRDTGKPHDRIFVHDYVLDVEIGVFTNEKGVTQRVGFSVDVDVMPATGALDDDIGNAFDYDYITKGIKSIIARGHINLVETLAEEVARPLPRPSPRGARHGEDREARQGSRRRRCRDRAEQGGDLRHGWPGAAKGRTCAAHLRGAAYRRQARRQRHPLASPVRLARCDRRKSRSRRHRAGGRGARRRGAQLPAAAGLRRCCRAPHGAARHGSARLGGGGHAAGLRGRPRRGSA